MHFFSLGVCTTMIGGNTFRITHVSFSSLDAIPSRIHEINRKRYLYFLFECNKFCALSKLSVNTINVH